ncbi:hypothetical protein MMC24_000794 [Lignoscripta atroalba]|nr:hypothetical protein [Lignoscripta atroalba]
MAPSRALLRSLAFPLADRSSVSIFTSASRLPRSASPLRTLWTGSASSSGSDGKGISSRSLTEGVGGRGRDSRDVLARAVERGYATTTGTRRTRMGTSSNRTSGPRSAWMRTSAPRIPEGMCMKMSTSSSFSPAKTTTPTPDSSSSTASTSTLSAHAAEAGAGAEAGAETKADSEVEPPDYLSPAELSIFNTLRREFAPTKLEVQDISGGCGSMYALSITSARFKGLPMVKQHRLVNEVLREEIAGWHGVQLRTGAV